MSEWLSLYESDNRPIRVRAARGLLRYHGRDVPLSTLVDILDHLCGEGLGAATERVLVDHPNDAVVDVLIETAANLVRPLHPRGRCRVVPEHPRPDVSQALVAALDDADWWIRTAAFALAHLRDPTTLKAVQARAGLAINREPNVAMGFSAAVRALTTAPSEPRDVRRALADIHWRKKSRRRNAGSANDGRT